MQSTLFIELTASEEANLSGGKAASKIKVKQVAKGGKAIIKDSEFKFDDDNSFNNSADASNTLDIKVEVED